MYTYYIHRVLNIHRTKCRKQCAYMFTVVTDELWSYKSFFLFVFIFLPLRICTFTVTINHAMKVYSVAYTIEWHMI